MGTITVQEATTKNPITLAGMEAGICWGADVSNADRNYRRGLSCFEDGHWRTMEFCVDMSRQRCCTRAYWEFRDLMKMLCDALSAYSDEWSTVIDRYVGAKCEFTGFCEESHSCGRYPKKER